ncbi:MAG: 50S ribosomal protein L28 [Candidatus Kerfeldbacteria bacterium]|nr:50S ribosomal protein L28 [Candidatus Kerfeldbacteria bacterium]
MARTCSICGRGAMNSYSRSHSNIATKRKQHLNLHTLFKDGRRWPACTSCIRSETRRLAEAGVKS